MFRTKMNIGGDKDAAVGPYSNGDDCQIAGLFALRRYGIVTIFGVDGDA